MKGKGGFLGLHWLIWLLIGILGLVIFITMAFYLKDTTLAGAARRILDIVRGGLRT